MNNLGIPDEEYEELKKDAMRIISKPYTEHRLEMVIEARYHKKKAMEGMRKEVDAQIQRCEKAIMDSYTSTAISILVGVLIVGLIILFPFERFIK